MVSFSEQQLDIIARNPLGEPLDRFRETLEHKDQSYSVLSNWDNEANDSDQDRQDVISKLLTTLMATQTAKHLLNSNGRKVAVDLAQLFSRVLEGDSHAKYHPLMKLVLEKASDIDIWNAVLSLINTALAPVTTPESILPTFDDSPIVYSSASQRDSEQTRELVEKRIFEEIRLCTFRDVEGFFEKYFEGKDWTRRALDTYEAAKGLHIDGAWTGFPDPPVQTGVLDWWFRFQHDFLSEERRGYYTSTKPTDLVGAEAQRQVDLFVRRKDGRLRDAAHEWKDIHVIGQLKASNHNKKALLLQMGRYVRDVFSHQPTRRYVHAFSICGREMEVWVFDRSGCYSPGAFNIDEEPRRFIQVIAGYTMMSDEEMGLDTFIERDTTESPTILIEQDEALDKDGKRLRLTAHPFTRQRAIVCRGTACFLTKPPESENWDYVTKFSWTSDQRKPEADLLRLARERGVRGIAELVGHHRITSINEMRSGLTFSKPYTFRTPIGTPQSHPQSKPIGVSELDQSITSSCVAKRLLGKRKSVDVDWRLSKRSRSKSHLSNKGQKESTFEVEAAQGTSLAAADIGLYDNRIFRCLVVSPAGRAIYKYSTHLELLEALRDAIKAHRSLHLEGNILHRDISENNIIITDRISTGYTGMLIDLDLAKELGSGRSGARCRTGTMEFMAVEVLRGISHTYRHDLESFFYVLLWLCARRGWAYLSKEKGRPRPSCLTKWYSGTYEEIALAKQGHMHADTLEFILDEFPEAVFDDMKPLCRELRDILFPYREGGFFLGTPKDPEILYGPIIEAFDEAIDDLRDSESTLY